MNLQFVSKWIYFLKISFSALNVNKIDDFFSDTYFRELNLPYIIRTVINFTLSIISVWKKCPDIESNLVTFIYKTNAFYIKIPFHKWVKKRLRLVSNPGNLFTRSRFTIKLSKPSITQHLLTQKNVKKTQLSNMKIAHQK